MVYGQVYLQDLSREVMACIFFIFLFLLFYFYLCFFLQQEKVAFGRMIGGAIEADMYV
jgi:hypothetical protein